MHLHHCTDGDVFPALVHSVTSVRGFVKLGPQETHDGGKTVAMPTRVAPPVAPYGETLIIPQHLPQRGCGRAQTTAVHDDAPVAPGRAGHRGAHLPGELGARAG